MIALTHDQIRSIAPSIFASRPWGRMSHRYRMVPTIEVINILEDQGFLPVLVAQSRSRIEGKGSFTKHLLRFRQSADLDRTRSVGDEIAEVVMVNSHDGSSSYQFMSGIFRLVCSNGMIVQSADFGSLKINHKGGADFRGRVIDTTFRIVEQAPKALEQIGTFKQLALTVPQQHAFAEAAVSLRDNARLEPHQVLAPRRPEDRPAPDGSRSLWTTLNVTQENLVRGGLSSRDPATGRRSTTRAIKSVDADVRTNRALWLLADRMSQLVG